MSDEASAVAVIGMSGRFPGARNLAEYWGNLRDGVCSIAHFSPGDLAADGTDPAELRRAGYVPAKGYLQDADRFEAELFGFHRNEAAVLDPQHRLLLEVVWSALEDAGYDPRNGPDRTGVYVGGSLTEHMIAAQADQRLAAEVGPMQVRILTDREFLAPWVSYRLGLNGPSLNVQTACSTSLTAIHLAVQGLLLGECDTALAGGVSIESVRKQGYLHHQGGIHSPDGFCRPFDEQAAGTVGGNGAGVVVLRRLADAIASGDPVRAVILGTAVTNDGSAKVGFTAPSVGRQAAAIVEAWSMAGLDPTAAQYLEMHGTGTSLGDQIEVAAVRAAFGDAADESGARCGIGSVKSNIGHLDAAAGVAGLIKVVQMLEHQVMVPTVNVTRTHPGLGLDSGRLRLVTGAARWEPPADGPRLAGVTGAGIGGSNVHVVLAEAPPVRTAPAPVRPAPAGDGIELLPLSARTETQLAIIARKLATELRGPAAPALADVAHTLRTGRTALPVRDYVLAATSGAAAEALAALAEGRAVPAAGDEALHALGERWRRGADVSWPPAAPGARRVHLPTYPFAGSSYGALTLTAVPAFATGPAGPAGPTGFTGPTGAAAPVSDATITDLLSASLGLTGPADLGRSYFAAGGDSLTAVHLIGRLRDDFGVDVPVELLFEEITLAELAGRITAVAAGRETDDTLLESFLDELDLSS
jgi:acyl transferase domain-containing protein/acyl carrier protein